MNNIASKPVDTRDAEVHLQGPFVLEMTLREIKISITKQNHLSHHMPRVV